MLIRVLPSAIAVCLACVSCDILPGNAPVTHEPPAASGMAWIHAQGKAFLQGSASAIAPPEEKPAVRLGFTYDFQIDTVEVTRAGYRALMGRDPSSRVAKDGNDYPVRDLSWFDAILFCNARSREAGFDTVYAYTRAVYSVDGSAYAIPDLSVRLAVRGYRLPTEAEWAFAAQAGSDEAYPWGATTDSAFVARYAWFEGNSGGGPHPVGRLSRNGFGLHDMAGNVMEWVQDWYQAYPGAPQAYPEFGTTHKVVRGGAYGSGEALFRTDYRCLSYPGSRSEWIGFRCAKNAP